MNTHLIDVARLTESELNKAVAQEIFGYPELTWQALEDPNRAIEPPRARGAWVARGFPEPLRWIHDNYWTKDMGRAWLVLEKLHSIRRELIGLGTGEYAARGLQLVDRVAENLCEMADIAEFNMPKEAAVSNVLACMTPEMLVRACLVAIRAWREDWAALDAATD